MRSALLIPILAWVVGLGAKGQYSWSATFDEFGSRTWMINGLIDQNGDLLTILIEADDPTFSRSYVLRVSSTGALLDHLHLAEPNDQTVMAEIRRIGSTGELMIIGSKIGVQEVHPEGNSVIAYYKLNPDLVLLDNGEVGVRAPSHGYLKVCIPEDGIITLAYTALFPSINGENQLHLLTMESNGDVLHENHVMSQLGWGSIGNISPWSTGGYVMTTHSFDYFDQPGAAFAMFLSDDLTPIVSSAFEPTTEENPAYLDNLRSPVYSIPRGNGELYVSGFYFREPDDHGALVRLTDSTGATLAEWEHNSPFYVDRPGIYRSMDMSANGDIWFAQTENENGFYNPIFPVIAPSRVRVVRFDEDLQSLGEYVINGFPDSLYYRHAAVVAAPDGGVYILGAVTDLSDPDGQPKAWIQKIGPDDLVSVAETAAPTTHLYPNPGTEGFTVVLNGPVVHVGALHLHDAQGRLVGTTPVQQNSARFNALGLAPGVYLYRITDAEGRPRSCGKWVKE